MGRRWLPAVVLAAVAIVLALAILYPRQWTRGFLVNEEWYFAQLARNLAEGQGFVSHTIYTFAADEISEIPAPEPLRGPGYPLVVAGLMRAGFEGLPASLIVSVFWMVTAVVATYWLALRIFGNVTLATVVAGVYLGTTTTLHHGTMAAPEMQFDALFLLACCLMIRPTPTRAAASGAAWYAVGATKSFGLLYAPLAMATIGWVSWRGYGLDGRDDLDGDEDPTGSPADESSKKKRAATRCIAFIAGITAAWLVVGAASGSLGAYVQGSSGSYASNLLMETSLYPEVDSPRFALDPPSALSYFAAHPRELVVKVLRLASRTRRVVNGMGAPALDDGLFWLLLATAGLAFAGRWPEVARRRRWLLWFGVAATLATLPLLWLYLIRIRYLYQLYPLFLIGITAQALRLRPAVRRLSDRERAVLAALGIVCFLAYPVAHNVREAYKDPYAFLGRSLAVRTIDYDELARDARAVVADGPILSDFAFELPWMVGVGAIFPPNRPGELGELLRRFDIETAILWHARSSDWMAELSDFDVVVQGDSYRILRRSSAQQTSAVEGEP